MCAVKNIYRDSCLKIISNTHKPSQEDLERFRNCRCLTGNRTSRHHSYSKWNQLNKRRLNNG